MDDMRSVQESNKKVGFKAAFLWWMFANHGQVEKLAVVKRLYDACMQMF